VASFLILHGIENHRPPEHWQFWLAAGLAERGHQVLYPGLPAPDAPSFDAWAEVLREQLSRLGADGGERVVICHSLACLLWVKAAPELAETQTRAVDRLLLVAPPQPERVPEAGASFRVSGIDAAAVHATAGEIRLVCSDSDPYNPAGAQALYGEPLGVEATVLAGAGHITPADGYGPWPALARWCEDPTRPLVAPTSRPAPSMSPLRDRARGAARR
jgi:predicted alpha/beta hydrolase family esterase